jgi:hypothetical protein
MSLLSEVTSHLESLEVRFALIGAAALAIHGSSRATLDIDLLLTDARVLDPKIWSGVLAATVEVTIRKGDLDDPLAGVVRLSAEGEREVDLVIGKRGWQREVIERAVPSSYASVDLPVVEPADLVLLKLYAGGPQDAWDIRQLLSAESPPQWAETTAERVFALPEDARRLWETILKEL